MGRMNYGRFTGSHDEPVRCAGCGAEVSETEWYDRVGKGDTPPPNEVYHLACTPPISITYLPTIGCYGVDTAGVHWATWTGPARPCSLCGATINGGWGHPAMGREGDGTEQWVCVRHVQTYGTPCFSPEAVRRALGLEPPQQQTLPTLPPATRRPQRQRTPRRRAGR